MRHLFLSVIFLASASVPVCVQAADPVGPFSFTQLASIPNSIGVAGPFAGVHRGVLIIAGGANFPAPTWESNKVWHNRIDVLRLKENEWIREPVGKLVQPTGYGAAVSTPLGIACLGGNNASETFDFAFLLQWDPVVETTHQVSLPSLPRPCAYGAATVIGQTIYLCGGQSGATLDTAMNQLWSFDLANVSSKRHFHWIERSPCPGPARAFNLTVSQRSGNKDYLYVISGRRQNGDDVEFLKDTWRYAPETDQWTRLADAPRSVMAGTATPWDDERIAVLGGADGKLFAKSDELQDKHPGFPKEAWIYDTASDSWISGGKIPANHVTTVAVPLPNELGGGVLIPSGEIRPRVRSPRVWRVTAK